MLLRSSLGIRLRRSRSCLDFNTQSPAVNKSNIRRVHKYVPPPTWSIQELQLKHDASTSEPLSTELLNTLSRRALLHIPDDDSYRKDLTNFMQLIQQVVDWNKEFEAENSEEIDAAELYDLPRGVKEAPLRNDDDIVIKTHPAVSLDKTVAIGSHKYFAIKTKNEDSNCS
ncbi:hypothetical protein MPSEU_000632400 [Mayamaea pseudoterrestris]|nr:hypothetical protein MPSEU_000632400 [Mayamaea pseudoterrestris]